MPVDIEARVISNTRLSADYNVIALAAPEIAAAAKSNGVKGCVCFELRFSGQMESTKAIIDQGLLGRTDGDHPTLHLTAEAMPEDAARCLAAGMDGHLAKPITQAALYAAIDAALAAASDRRDDAQAA